MAVAVKKKQDPVALGQAVEPPVQIEGSSRTSEDEGADRIKPEELVVRFVGVALALGAVFVVVSPLFTSVFWTPGGFLLEALLVAGTVVALEWQNPKFMRRR